MAFTNQSMAGIAFAAYQVGSQITVTDIRLVAKTMDTCRICKKNAYIVQHGSLVQKILIQ